MTDDPDLPDLRGSAQDLAASLASMDGRSYGAYKAIRGRWSLGRMELVVDHVQGDPFAAPSRVRLMLPPAVGGWAEEGPPLHATRSRSRTVGLEAFLARAFDTAARARGSSRGSGRSGQVRMTHTGQLAVPTTALRIEPDGGLEARFTVGLPARGRRVLGL
ncbi:MAG: ATPase, partial [Gemmatimonadales bacterium]